MKVFLVGGAVRDKLLGLPVNERDWVVVDASPEVMIEHNFKPVGKDFPVFLHPRTKEEYALARTERKTGKGYHGFVFHAGPDVTLEEDLRRRDLTINAMAVDDEGELIDPFGGLDDLHKGVLRHVSPAFAEDPVRVLRIARFLARFQPKGFYIADDTLELMRTMSVKSEISTLVPERIWKELTAALITPAPAAFFRTLKDTNTLEIIAAELDILFGELSLEKLLANALSGAASKGKAEVSFAVLVSWAAAADLLLDEWCAGLKAPKNYRQLTRVMPQLYKLTKTSADFSAESLFNFFKQNDLLRNPQRLGMLMPVWRMCALPSHLDAYRGTPVCELIYSALHKVIHADLSSALKHDNPREIKIMVETEQIRALNNFLSDLSEQNK